MSDDLVLEQTFGTQRRSSAQKIFGLYGVYRSLNTCAPSCPFYTLCYAGQGNVKLHAYRAQLSQLDLKEWVANLPRNAIIRYLVSGDLYTPQADPSKRVIDIRALNKIVRVHELYNDVKGVGYTHGWRDIGEYPIELDNLRINASCETRTDIEEAKDLGWPTVRTVRRDHEPEDDEVICHHYAQDIPCIVCLCCLRRPEGQTINLPAHGSTVKRLEILLDQLNDMEVTCQEAQKR